MITVAESERVLLAEIYRVNGIVVIDGTVDTNIFELLEFMRVYIRFNEKALIDSMANNLKDGDEEL